MKKLLYPKTYATIVDIISYDISIYVVNNGKVGFKKIYPIYVFQTDDGREIRQQSPGRSGSTPRWLNRRYYELYKNKKAIESYLIGVRVKLYQRPKDNGKWSYRHMGE